MTEMTNGDPLESAFAGMRREMVTQVAAMAEELASVPGTPTISQAVLQAMNRVPRHRFVPDLERESAYQNRPLAIGYDQTISQPYIVALMTDLLRIGQGSRVLEVGTGCGYQSAVLAEMGAEVYTIEIVAPLAEQAAGLLHALGYTHVHSRQGDGYHGWPEQAPFDAIIVTAGVTEIPQPLIDQLKPGGRLAIPLGEAFATQQLLLIEKNPQGEIHREEVLPVRFVPLTGKH